MRRALFFLSALTGFLSVFTANAKGDTVYTVRFRASDGLEVTADIYHVSEKLPVMVLCHQYGWSRGEFVEIAKKLNKLGFNCLAVDLRAGRQVNGVVNQTARTARLRGISTERLDARKDIEAAVDFASSKYGRNVLLLGSSYSATLVLMVAKNNPRVESVIAFSPGEHYPGLNVRDFIQGLDKPAFLTSSKAESQRVGYLFMAITSIQKVHFIPKGRGYHAAKALWSSNAGNEEYWEALKAFLGK